MSQYKSILKATSIFGGTQLLQMFVTIIRSKIIALFVGSAGMGLSTIYMSSLSMIITIFGLGLGTSVIKELTKTYNDGDMYKFSIITLVYKRILIFLSILGVIFVILISSNLSIWAFGTHEHTIDFCFLSLIVLFSLLNSGNNALLISMRKIKAVAACNIICSIASLLACVPLFYLYGIEGIVPGLVFSSFVSFFVTWIYVRKIKIENYKIKFYDIITYGRTLISLGVAMTISILVGQISNYGINISITKLGGLSDLGFYNAGVAITTQIISMVFAAMTSDYYPRLVSSMSSSEKMSETVNEQSEILFYLSVPILSFFMIISPILIRILLTEEFYAITDFIRIVCFGMIIKVASYALGAVSFAKGDKKIYLILEAGYTNFAHLFLSVIFYYIWGLNGLAFSFVVDYLLYYFIVYFVDKKVYKYEASSALKKLTVLSFTSLGSILVMNYLFDNIIFYIFSSILCTLIIYIYMSKLNNKTNFLLFIKSKIVR